MIKKVRDFLELYLLHSFLNKTCPLSRIIFCLVLCTALFINGTLTLIFISILVLIISLTDPQMIIRHVYLFILTIILTGVLISIETVLPQSLSSFLGKADNTVGIISILKMMWKIIIIIFGSIVFVVLVPQNHIVYALRNTKCPQLWISVIAAFRATEIGYFAMVMVRKTQISKKITLWSPFEILYYIDSFVTGLFGHLFHIVNEFELAIRSKGVESLDYMPAEKIPQFGYYDLGLFAITISLIFAAIKGF